jgi:hypothetical protein
MLREILAGVLVIGVMGAIIIGCGPSAVEEPEVKDEVLSVEEPKIRSGVLSVEEYLEVCPSWSYDPEDDVKDQTWGEVIDESAKKLELMKSAHAPKELEDYHISQVMVLAVYEEEVRKVGKDKEDELFNLATVITSQLMFIAMVASGEDDDLSDDLRNRLINVGCVDADEVEVESETLTP